MSKLYYSAPDSEELLVCCEETILSAYNEKPKLDPDFPGEDEE